MAKTLFELLNSQMDSASSGLSSSEVSLIAGRIQSLKDLLDDPPKRMSEWEYDFIENLESSYNQIEQFSVNKIAKVEELWNRYCI